MTEVLGGAAEASMPLIAVILLIRELANFAKARRKNADGTNGGKAVAEARIERIDQRTEEMAASLASLPRAIDRLTEAFEQTARAVDRLVERAMNQHK